MTQSEQINIIVVGAGYGGLSAAIELTKKGCKVRVFEAAKKLTNQGSSISSLIPVIGPITGSS
jgi:2-polyprenyl-6-methoxyphenol hydroxylase-like FAD-dependent oxidoreductase